MKLIEPKVELIQQSPGLVGMYKHIERCARTCYKSEDKITEDSYMTMMNNLIQRNHLAMLEHGTVYLKDISWSRSHLEKYKTNKYSKYNEIYLDKEEIEDGNDYDVSYKYGYYVTTNLRVIIENHWDDDLQYICEPTEFHERRITLKFITNIGVTREGNRHRVNSIAEQSTRYCNYTKEKFGNHITCCKPVWITKDNINSNAKEYEQSTLDNLIKEYGKDKEHCWIDIDYYIFSLLTANYCYNNLINLGWSPQQAREVLPLATKSEVVYTAFASDWKHWFSLRLFGTTGKPHPNMEQIARLAKEELVKNNLWNLIYPENERN